MYFTKIALLALKKLKNTPWNEQKLCNYNLYIKTTENFKFSEKKFLFKKFVKKSKFKKYIFFKIPHIFSNSK